MYKAKGDNSGNLCWTHHLSHMEVCVLLPHKINAIAYSYEWAIEGVSF